jgi:endogenous inhibitor of DNA gyrase (YacG/DUF329 family)
MASCPICSKPTQTAFAPFCSKRCADLDLGKWLKGDYSVPVVEMDDLPDIDDISDDTDRLQ